jgi:hypothetical protein
MTPPLTWEFAGRCGFAADFEYSSDGSNVMQNRILPRQIDNDYRGHKLALWLFGATVLVKLGIGLGTVFNGHEAAGSADGIPLDTFTPAGAQAVISLFAIWGIAQLVICVLCILALVRFHHQSCAARRDDRRPRAVAAGPSQIGVMP